MLIVKCNNVHTPNTYNLKYVNENTILLYFIVAALIYNPTHIRIPTQPNAIYPTMIDSIYSNNKIKLRKQYTTSCVIYPLCTKLLNLSLNLVIIKCT